VSAAGCAFCEIIDGTRPAAIVASEDAAVAFLDARPVFKGHVLVVPRAHVATLTDLPAGALGPYFAADGTFVAMNNKVSQSVAHLHTHVVPRRRKDGLRGFFWPRVPYASDEERDDFAARIRSAAV
jgi:histidine triad (HIT) family protein